MIWRRPAVRYGVVVVGLAVGLFLLFPRALGFVEMAARELRYLWWLVLLILLGLWMLWASRRRPE